MSVPPARPTLAILAAATLLTACSSARYATPSERGDADRTVEVEVTNNNWLDMTVHAVSGGTRVRLGTVTTGTRQRFDLPRILNVRSTELRLSADPVGSTRTYHSRPILVEPGSRVQWSLENHLALSSFSVVSLRR